MIAFDPDRLCRQAERHYYDFLSVESRKLVPDSVVSHILQCSHCQAQVDQLESALLPADGAAESSQRQADRALTAMLRLHFAYMGKQVTCTAVRPFLAGMLNPILEISIPTPITVHLDNCAKCSQDLEVLRGLNLSQRQLCRLSLLLGEMSDSNGVSCSEARAVTPAIVSMALGQTSEEVLKHVCTCPDCRRSLYRDRDAVRRKYVRAGRDLNRFPCEKVVTSDVFDYVVPYGLDPTDDQYGEFRESLASHLRCCPTCLGKMQEVHRTVYGILEQPESGVATTYYTDRSADARTAGESDDLYSGFPIRVQVSGAESKAGAGRSAPLAGCLLTIRQAASAKRLKPFLKPFAAAAAVIIIASAVFFSTSATGATALDEIYRAIEDIKNVHIATSVPGQSEPIQEKWVSRTMNAYMTKTGSEFVLWDLSNGVRTTRQLDAATTVTAPLSDDYVPDIERRMSGSLGLLPFHAISDVPKDATWSPASDENVGVTAGDTQVWDLMWADKASDGSTVLRKWTVFTDAKTSLPQKIERYRSLGPADAYILRSVMVIEYLSDRDMQDVVEKMSL
ncbi:MAG: hypothetical protein JSU70_09970 [Phycisphaerales bacterium]|nr:MAG: hypothetical protein JSU70_09970 [Phycisphaerales bacterium]